LTHIKKAKNAEIDSLVLLHVNTHSVQLFLDVMGARHYNVEVVMVLNGTG